MSRKSAVWDAVEDCRAKFRCLQALPVDVIEAMELDMRINMIPFPNLFRHYSVDAALKPDFSGIYVDRNAYESWDGQPEWMYYRLRFSLAHELGHIVLHRDIVPQGGFKTLDEYWQWERNTYAKDRYTLEWAANEFAGRLLVPLNRLQEDFDGFVAGAEKEFPTWWEKETLRNSLCERLSARYQVCPKAISARLDREGLWPSE